MTLYELKPEYDGRASFYQKALVEVGEDGEKTLYSYLTPVAEVTEELTLECVKSVARVFGTYSATTLRHIKEFLKQEGFRAESLKQIRKDYMGGAE